MLLHRRFVYFSFFLYYLFIYSIMGLYQYRLMDTDFIFWVIVQYCIIYLLLSLFQA